MNTAVRSSTVTAKKKHQCNYCGGDIEVGTKYKSEFIIGDDGGWSWKSHIECLELANKLNWFDDCDEGLTGAAFCDGVCYEYDSVMNKHYNEIYKSDGFEKPDFKDRLQFLFKHYEINH